VNLSTTCGNEGRVRSYHTYGLESRLTWAMGDMGSLEIGARAHRERQTRRQLNGDTPTSREAGIGVNAGIRENNRRFVWAYSGFVQGDFKFGSLGIQPGIRVEHIKFDRINKPISVISGGQPTGALTTETRGESDLTEIIPGLGFTYALNDRASLYAGVHRGFAPPRVEDIITTSGGSIDLDAEKSWNYEIGIRGDVISGINGDFTIFQMDFDNQIIPASVAGGVGATLTSAGKTLHRGAELSARFSSEAAGLTTGWDLFARTAITWMETAEFRGNRRAVGCAPGQPTISFEGVAFSCDTRGNRLPYSPKWLLSAAVGVKRDWISGLIEVQHQSGAFADDVNSTLVTADGQRGFIPAWTIFNATLNITPEDSAFSGYVSVKNMFDKLYISDRARGILPGTPRLVQAGVRLSF
jgi:Fe(3+) dicitrate transport protein